jgi:transposase-like protein
MTFFEFQAKFPTTEAVIQHFLYIRYPNGLTCPHCHSIKVYQKHDRPKVFNCNKCKNTFSIFKGTFFERTRVDLRKWFYAVRLFLNGKKGISGLQLQRELGVAYQTAWQMLQKIRIAMSGEDLSEYFQNIVEIDETYVGGKPRKGNMGQPVKRGRGTTKTPVVGVLDRDNKKVYARVALPNRRGQKLTGKQLFGILKLEVKYGATVMTDQFRSYNVLRKNGFIHFKIDHSKRYADGDIHTNNIESFWATLKRAIYGVYHSISVKYMQLYVNEFCFRYNNKNDPKIFDILLLRMTRENKSE